MMICIINCWVVVVCVCVIVIMFVGMAVKVRIKINILYFIYLYKGVLHYFESRVCMILRCSLITWIIQSVVHSPFWSRHALLFIYVAETMVELVGAPTLVCHEK